MFQLKTNLLVRLFKRIVIEFTPQSPRERPASFHQVRNSFHWNFYSWKSQKGNQISAVGCYKNCWKHGKQRALLII